MTFSTGENEKYLSRSQRLWFEGQWQGLELCGSCYSCWMPLSSGFFCENAARGVDKLGVCCGFVYALKRFLTSGILYIQSMDPRAPD